MPTENAGARGAGNDYDVVVVGSGFGGSVAALRLSEKGYRVLVLEAGRRFTRESLPKTSWSLKDYLWAPRLGLYGIQRIHVLGNVMVLAGAGVGGGSLNYANTLYVPPKAFFQDPQWGAITDWEAELKPYYAQARRMLGVRQNPTTTEADEYLRTTAEAMGVGPSFTLTPVGVFFGDGKDADGATKASPGEEAEDPYFGGAGPKRRACVECGECMTGCRHGAKNTLPENYLYLAERAGAEIRPMTTVVDIRARAAAGGSGDGSDAGYEVHVVPTDRRRKAKPTVIRCEKVVVAAGTYGTQTLLHKVSGRGGLPRISARLGVLTRTNSEALVGALTFPRPYRRRRGTGAAPDFTQGVAITSSIHPNATTHIENVRYGKGSNTMALMCVPQYRAGGRMPKALAAAFAYLAHPVMVARTAATRHWSERTIIGLVMQTHDNSLTTYLRSKRPGRGLLTARQGHGAPNPVHIPEGAEAARMLAEQIGGLAGTNLGELLGMPLTAHFLGGCPIAADPEHGVIDPYQRLYGHPGISVVDGSAVSANLGVNPSLTITAQAERAMALWPNRGEPDPRPAQDAGYRRLDPVEPLAPAVPASAFGRLDYVNFEN
ncbi:GMC family oxidoreductase [Actinospica durhamensis]|uniref:Cholesterol oxidase n=1 Tax=Actinospica durhamensis TaxID=1508375 RepID=A0A941F0G3_9ACTN|nr:GMC oxidoreductase [Actinospica durhamensis]MBR7839139.1 GMC family oxidoreductase [Actinospica durhamensis]